MKRFQVLSISAIHLNLQPQNPTSSQKRRKPFSFPQEKRKISKGDILGFLTAKGGLEANEVGQIDISDHYSIVAIPAGKASMVLKRIQQEKIKNKKVKITIARQ